MRGTICRGKKGPKMIVTFQAQMVQEDGHKFSAEQLQEQKALFEAFVEQLDQKYLEFTRSAMYVDGTVWSPGE